MTTAIALLCLFAVGSPPSVADDGGQKAETRLVLSSSDHWVAPGQELSLSVALEPRPDRMAVVVVEMLPETLFDRVDPEDPFRLRAVREGVCRVRVRGGGLTSNAITLVVRDSERPTERVSSLRQYGVTWTFEEPVRAGRFVSGDWWVVGPVTVVSKSPAASGEGHHGSMVNPPVGRNSGYDPRVPFYDPNLSATFPLKLEPGDSLVSTVSHLGDKARWDLLGRKVSVDHCHLESAAVLTVVEAPLPPTSFRPPYVGTARPYFDRSALRTDRLPNLEPQVGPYCVGRDVGKRVCQQYAEYFERPWILHVTDWVGRQTHPSDNMPNYHREVYNLIADTSLLLLCDLRDREDLLTGFVQLGIDSHFVSQAGAGDSSLHKWTILFAGLMLDSPELLGNRASFRTDWMTYRVEDAASPVASRIVSEGQGWTGAKVLWRQDPGEAEHEHLHPEEWEAVPLEGGGRRREVYRRSNSVTWPGVALAARLMNAQRWWRHEPFFEYADRWMAEDDSENFVLIQERWDVRLPVHGGTCSSPFVENMWKRYRKRDADADGGEEQ
ncbi:MAG: hypothetical protein AAF488_11970 [Planctomycetota bacterium]